MPLLFFDLAVATAPWLSLLGLAAPRTWRGSGTATVQRLLQRWRGQAGDTFANYSTVVP